MSKFEILRRLRNIEYKRNQKHACIRFKIYAVDALEVFSGELDIIDARKMAATLTEMCDKFQLKHEQSISKAAKKAAKKSGITCPMSEREDVVLTVGNCPDLTNALTPEHQLSGPLVVVSEWTGQSIEGSTDKLLSREQIDAGIVTTAQIPHRCSWCGKTINKGELYMVFSGVFALVHIDCNAAIIKSLGSADQIKWPEYCQDMGAALDV